MPQVARPGLSWDISGNYSARVYRTSYFVAIIQTYVFNSSPTIYIGIARSTNINPVILLHSRFSVAGVMLSSGNHQLRHLHKEKLIRVLYTVAALAGTMLAAQRFAQAAAPAAGEPTG